MRNLVLRLHRPMTETSGDVKGRLALHRERSKMLHGLAEALGFEVVDWGLTDDKYPREWVEIIVAISSAAMSAAVGEVVKVWMASRKMRDVEIVRQNGTTVSVRGMSQDELKKLGGMLWARSTPQPTKRKRKQKTAPKKRRQTNSRRSR